jgi:4-amino-4-deoxy-L-arabinose transferase-like glycosyltransferase
MRMSGDDADRLRLARLALAALALGYVGAHLAWYGSTPMGGFPVLDGREILAMAVAMADGTLPAEPFYRAPLYPALLAVPAALGVPSTALPDVARFINLGAHIASTLLVFELARSAWKSLSAGIVAGGLYAMYPVAAHFAGDPLDVTLATALLLAASLLIVRATDRLAIGMAAWAGVLAAMAILARPNLLLAVPVLTIWPLWVQGLKRGWPCALTAGTGAIVVFAALGFVNLKHGGEFRVLPWQGSHALWDGNGPRANGLFYQHEVKLPELVPGTNPARAEAEAIYCAAVDCTGGIVRDQFIRFWWDRTLAHVLAHPADWLMLLARKAWYAINNYEQYNNKTYWLHKERSPWLRHNPLSFGLLLALAIGALALPWASRAGYLHGSIVLAILAGLVIYFASARFRVPAAAWLAVLAGGWAVLWSHRPSLGDRIGWQKVAPALGLAVCVGVVSFWPVPDHLRYGTIGEDYALLASAALSANRPDEAEYWAGQVLARDPSRSLAHALICSARFVAWELSELAGPPPESWLEDSLAHCGAGIDASDRARYNAAFFMLALCRRDEAISELAALESSRLIGAESQAALVALGVRSPVMGKDLVGLQAMMASQRLTTGQRSIVDAAMGKHCPLDISTPLSGTAHAE